MTLTLAALALLLAALLLVALRQRRRLHDDVTDLQRRLRDIENTSQAHERRLSDAEVHIANQRRSLNAVRRALGQQDKSRRR